MLSRTQARGPAHTSCERARWAVDALAGRLPGTRCLARSFALLSLLRAYGLDGELRFGVARSNGREIAAHAWVESGGLPLEDPAGLRDLVPLLSASR